MSRRRGGTTLVEVLVAIFIMAIGLMTLLTLFPLGALSMAQAIKDTRTGHAVANATAIAEALQDADGHDLRTRLLFKGRVATPASWDTDPFRNPGNLPSLTSNPSYLAGPSYPVLIDPIGVFLSPNNPQTVGGVSDGIPRRSIFAPVNIGQINRWFVLQDDMNFLKDGDAAGLPCLPGGTVEREGRYSWAYMLRWPRASDAVQGTVHITQQIIVNYFYGQTTDLTVIVFSGRPATVPFAEQEYPNVTWDSSTNQVSVPYTGPKPDIRKGSWVLDSTLVKQPGNVPEPHGFFYRVVNVIDNGSSPLILELQDKPKLSTAGNYGRLVFMENVVEVFEKGAGWKP